MGDQQLPLGLLYPQYRLEQDAEVEILASYEPALTMFGEWYKQLMAESEGKEGKEIDQLAKGIIAQPVQRHHQIGRAAVHMGQQGPLHGLLILEKPRHLRVYDRREPL